MDLKEIYDTRKPPYIHNALQTEQSATSLGVETPGDAQKAIGQAVKQVRIFNDGGEWKYNNFDGLGDIVITGEGYEPIFKVRGVKLYVDDSTSFATFVYDLPFSTLAIEGWATGVILQLHITKLWTGNANNTTGLSITLFG